MIFFFIQKFNDIDHLVPIIYKIAKDKSDEVMVLSLNPYLDMKSDFRLRFLREKYNVKIDYLYNIYSPSMLYKILLPFLSISYYGGGCKSILKKTNKLSDGEEQEAESFGKNLVAVLFSAAKAIIVRFKIFEKWIIGHYGKKWVANMIDHFNPSVFVFDHAATVRIANISAIWDLAEERGIPKISLPHGVPLLLVHPEGYDKGKQDFAVNKCDFIVFQHRWWKDECVQYGVAPNKALTLGLVRYCKEWVEILQKIIPPDVSLLDKGKGKLKIVYMDSGPDRFSQYKSVAREAVNKICELDFVHLIYKPHTRRNLAHLEIPPYVEFAKNINSVNLIKWADVVIGMHSSIMIEVLIQNKVYISPTYFRDIKTIYEECGACWMVNSPDELINAITKLSKDLSDVPYSRENVERFLTDVVYDGDKGRDVLEVYKNFILSSPEKIKGVKNG